LHQNSNSPGDKQNMNRATVALTRILLLAGACCAGDDPPVTPKPDLGALSLEQLMNIKVQAAALHPQSLADAPASVTIITVEDIRKYGYRTLGEALASVRGFYSSNNRTYETVGVRGFSFPGDYASRIRVMVNGHNMADNVFNYMLYFGNDFPIDMNLIRQIEIIRGPSSALYGSNGIFATINIITKLPGEITDSLTTDVGSFGQKKGQVTVAASEGKASVLVSGSVFNNSGQSVLFFPEFNSPETNNGRAINMDGEKGYHFFSTLTWRNWTITAVAAGRSKIQPVSWGNTMFNDRGTAVNDDRDYVEAAYTRELKDGTLRWRTHYDSFQFEGRADFPLDSAHPATSGVDENISVQRGKWIGSQLDYRFAVPHLGTLTVGTEAKFDIQALQSDFDVSPLPYTYLHTNNPDRNFALFAQDERRLSSHWTLDLGARLDYSANRQSFLSPRVALLYQPSSGWTYKFLYGRAFRNPSAFELYYDDGLSGVGNPLARSEKADTGEFDIERRLGKRMNLVTSVYQYRLSDFLVPTRAASGLIQYLNVGKIRATGIEAEINGRPASWLETTASYSWQKANDSADRLPLENSPRHLAKLRFAVPIGRKFDASSGMQYYSTRLALGGTHAGPVYLADFTITSKHLLPDLDVQFGIRNAFNRNYADPVALNPRVDPMQQPGRTVYVQLLVHRSR
jgi:outer membrane receptor protein involved in Fe transport